MILRLLRRLAAVAVLACALGGCGSPNPSLYTIAPVPGPAASNGPQVVMLRELGLARYLEDAASGRLV